MKTSLLVLGSLVMAAAISAPASAVTAAEAHRNAIVWLETNQNPDGSWGSGLTQPVATAEALLALAKGGRARGPAAERAAAWLLTRSPAALDHRARAVRALAAAGFPTQDLASFGAATTGWGPIAADEGVTSYDTGLVMAAIRTSGDQATNLSAPVAEVISRRRADAGWSGDDVPHSQNAKSDLTVTAEITRAMAVVDSSELAITMFALSGAVGPAQSTLEVAARLAAIHALVSQSDSIENELLGRMSGGSWGADPLVNALGLLAISTRPGRVLGGTSMEDDDGDACANSVDAFPQDPSECLDSDGDGRGDQADHDDDGDGVCEGLVAFPGECVVAGDPFALNPREWADTDGDGTGDQADEDADGDGVSDDGELEAGTDPLLADTDEDGVCDGMLAVGACSAANDPCPAVASAVDLDGDGVCSDRDECDLDSSDWRDTDDDGSCDVADADDDGDGFSDEEELAAGTDPRDPASMPADLAALIPAGDFDGDGLTNEAEGAAGTSPFLADTDQDGATDLAELSLGSALDPALSPVAPPGVFGAFGAFPDAGGTFLAEKTSTLLRGTATGGQPTPVARPGGSLDFPASGVGFELLAGFQPQCTAGRDLDGDGLSGLAEAIQRTSFARVDTDADGFVDGPDGFVSTAGYTGGPVAWDLDPDGFVDGEADHGTDPTDATDRPGKPGDVAPLGLPDGRVNAGDATVELQIAADPGRTAALSGQRKEIADQAADANSDQEVDVRDALHVLRQAASATP
jgi:hypothetical protein